MEKKMCLKELEVHSDASFFVIVLRLDKFMFPGLRRCGTMQ